MKEMNIHTSRLLLRTIEREDAKTIVKLRNQDSLYKYYKNPCKLTIEAHDQWYKNSYLKDSSRYDFVIILLENRRIIGTCGINNLDISRECMEVSYLLDENYRKNGYAAEAVTALINMAENTWNVKEVSAVIHRDNMASVCFIKNLGFIWKCTTDNFSEYIWRRNN